MDMQRNKIMTVTSSSSQNGLGTIALNHDAKVNLTVKHLTEDNSVHSDSIKLSDTKLKFTKGKNQYTINLITTIKYYKQ